MKQKKGLSRQELADAVDEVLLKRARGEKLAIVAVVGIVSPVVAALVARMKVFALR